MKLTRNEIMDGVFLTHLETDKFKSDCLSLNLLTQLDRETVSMAALLPRVLARGSENHPTMDAISAACDELYGARIIPVVRKRGEILTLGFYCGFIADKFTPDGSRLLEPVSELLGEILLRPALGGAAFRKDYVESEKQKLIEDIRAKLNDKRDYAHSRMLEEMCAYEDYGCDEMGTEESAEAVTPGDLTDYYELLLSECPIEIFYCGSSPFERVEDALLSALRDLPRGELNFEIGTDIRMNAVETEPRYVEEALSVTQGKLVMGFRLGECMEDPDFAAIRVFNAIYGGTVNSKLFMNVREKLSLCYYASSGCDRLKGVMIVSSGIEFDKFEEAKAEILAQLDNVRKGDFTDEELSSARTCISSDLIALTDSPSSLEEFYLLQTLCGLDYSPVEFAEMCREVSRDDVIAVAQGIELDLVYFLKGNGLTEEDEYEED